MADRTASLEITATSRGLAARLREARTKFSQFADGVKGELNKKLDLEKGGGIGKKWVAGTLANLSSSAISRATGFVEDIGKSTFEFNDKLVRLQITAESTPGAMQDYAESIRKASDETGIAKKDILDAGYAFVALTGDMDTAKSSTLTWARVAQATGTSIQDISSAAAAMSQQLGIAPKEMEEVFGGLANQGKKGAVELNHLAAGFSQIAPQWALFRRGMGVEGVHELGAALQIVTRGFGGNAEETVTGLQGMLVAFQKNAKRFEAAGVHIMDKDGKGHKSLRNVLDIVRDIGKSKLVDDPEAMEKAFGRIEGYRAYLQLKNNADELDRFKKIGEETGVIQRDLSTYLDSAGGRVAKRWEEAKNIIADAFTPERIKLFTDALVGAAGAIAKIVQGVGTVLDYSKKAGEGLAIAIGGLSEEDRIEQIKSQRFLERQRMAAQQVRQDRNKGIYALAPGAGGAEYTAGELTAGAVNVAQEDALLADIRKQAGGGRISRMVKNEKTGKMEDAGNYSVQELQALRNIYRNSTDSAMLAKEISNAMVAALKDNINITVQLGENAIATANAKANKHRSAPKH